MKLSFTNTSTSTSVNTSNFFPFIEKPNKKSLSHAQTLDENTLNYNLTPFSPKNNSILSATTIPTVPFKVRNSTLLSSKSQFEAVKS